MARRPASPSLSLVLPLLLLCSVGPAQGEEAPPHPIDATLERCVDADPSTLGVMACIGNADAAWDAELNAVWAELKATLPPEVFAKLLDAQRAWLAYRDAEYEALGALYATAEGTMFRPMLASDRMELTRGRARDLRGLLGVYRVAQEP